MRWGIIAALVLGCGFCAADEIDLEAVRETLDTAVDTYFEEIIELDKEITAVSYTHLTLPTKRIV